MKVKIERRKDKLSVFLCGELDHHSAGPLRESVDSELAAAPVKSLILDFSGVDFCDSSAFGFVMGRYKLVSASGGGVELCGAKGQVKKMFELSGAGRYIKIKEGKA